VIANKGTFHSQALVANTNGAAELMAMELNSETNAEVEVYVEAKRQDHQEEPVTPADVALYVDAVLAAEIEAENASSAEVATAIRSGVEAEYRYLMENDVATQTEIDAVVEGKGSAFGRLQADLATGGNASESMNVFVSALADANAEAGIGHASSAAARQTAELVIESLSEGLSVKARFALRQHAHLLAASSTSAAVEAEFDAEPGMDAQASAVADAALTLRSSIMDASTEAEIETAWSDFRAVVNAELTSGLAIGSALQTAIETTIAAQSASFESSVSDATTVDDFVRAKADFNTQLRAALEGQLSAVADAGFGSRVLTLVSAR